MSTESIKQAPETMALTHHYRFDDSHATMIEWKYWIWWILTKRQLMWRRSNDCTMTDWFLDDLLNIGRLQLKRQSDWIRKTSCLNQMQRCKPCSRLTANTVSGNLIMHHFAHSFAQNDGNAIKYLNHIIDAFMCDWFYSIRLKQGTRHAERGEYEIRNGKQVFIIRGYFGHITPQVITNNNFSTEVQKLIQSSCSIFFYVICRVISSLRRMYSITPATMKFQLAPASLISDRISVAVNAIYPLVIIVSIKNCWHLWSDKPSSGNSTEQTWPWDNKIALT